MAGKKTIVEGRGVKDTAAKRYFGQKEVFADLCNAFLFQERGRLKPSMLKPMPTEYNELLPAIDGRHGSRKRTRDLSFQAYTDGDAGYALICAEFQSAADNTMPVRVMEYDSLGYACQLRQGTGGSAGKVLPISTIVVNLGRESWKGPTSLHGMFPEVNDFVKANVPDYPIRIYDPRTEDTKILDLLYTDLKIVSYLFRFSDRGDLLAQMYGDDGTSSLCRDGVDLVNVCLDMNLKEPEEGRRLEMCKAVEDLKAMGRKEGRKEGIARGIARGRKEGISEGIAKVAANALRNRMSLVDVQAITGLSEARILQIAQKIKQGANC